MSPGTGGGASGGRPGDLAGGQSGDQASTRAIFQSLVLIAFVDGRPDLSEADVVRELVALDPRFTGLGEVAFELGVQARLLLDRDGVEDALARITAPITSAADRHLTFQLCARVMFADGKTEGEEAMALGTLQEAFGLSHDVVLAALEAERKRRA
jgi:hypothetical protein